jgi:hypothetical protein
MKRLLAPVVVLVMSGAAGVSGQTTTGRLIGKVIDKEGAVLPGVNVAIDSPALIGGTQTRVTDSFGEFSFVGIAPGQYTVKTEHPGFIPQERASVRVFLGHATSLTIAMPQGVFSGEIEVVDETPVVDPTQVNSGQIFEQSYMQDSAVGSVNRDYLVIVNQAAGVAGGSSWEDFAQPKVFGSTIGENAYFIDGMDTTNPAMATATGAMNFDAVGEIQLQTGGFEAEYGRATGGVLNVVTRSGGNQFSGTLDIRHRDSSFQESGDHFDTSELETSFQQYSVTLGGPILRDKVWFFLSYQMTNDQFTPIASPTTNKVQGQNYLAKVTWQIADSWRLTGRYSRDPRENENWNASRWVMPDATAVSKDATAVFSGELNSVLSESLLWNTTLGLYDYTLDRYPQHGDLQTIAHYNYDTGLATHSYGNQQYWNSPRKDFTTDLTWFVDDLAGTHEFKVGIEYSDISLSELFCYTGTPNGERCIDDGVGLFIYDIEVEGETVPFLMWEGHTSGENEYTGNISTGFIQDAWRPARNLTLKVGLRFDAVTYDTNNATTIADMAMLQPRLGVAWDMTGNAKNILRGSWGRFMHPNALTLPWHVRDLVEPGFQWYSCSGVLPLYFGIMVGSSEECAAAASDLGWDYRLDHDNWEPFGWVLAPWEHYGTEPNQIDPNLTATYADELILAFEREVGYRSSIELTWVDKSTRDITDDTCNGNWPDPAADAECNYYVHANLPELKRDYRAFMVRYETRGFDWLALLATYTYSTSKGSVEYTQNAGQVADFYPWHYNNRYGYLSDHRTHRLKLNGFVNLKGDWSIAFDAFWSSPFTWAPYENRIDNPDIPYGVHLLEPRGNRNANGNYQLDLQLSKGFTIGQVRLVAIGSVYNVFSDERPTSVCARVSGCGDINMGEPTNWQTPRRYEVGFRVEF